MPNSPNPPFSGSGLHAQTSRCPSVKLASCPTFLHYLHDHRDISIPNIMMDARPLFPDGYHPVHQNYTRDALYRVSPLPRLQNPVRYYFIDFGLSTRVPPDASSYVVGEIGRDTDVPELSDHVPYDAFKVDIFSLGHVYHKEFEQVSIVSLNRSSPRCPHILRRNSKTRSSLCP